MKKILLLFLCVISFNAIHAKVTWTLYSDGTLTISGTGDMEGAPWLSQRDEIKKVVIKDGVTSIGGGAFADCSGLTSVTIPNSVTSIGESAFYGCYSLASVTIPNSVTSIGEGGFCYCSGLTSVTIGNSVTSIGGSAFEGCSGLTSLNIPNSVTGIGHRAFWQCSGLTSVTIGNSVTSIGGGAFADCSGLTSVTIPNSVTSIGEYAFEGCSGLASLTIPNSVTSIGSYAFKGTKWYDNQPDGVVYAGKVLYVYKGTMPSNTKINIKEGTTEITPSAFSGCSGLTSLTIPNSVTSIGGGAFSGCSGLTSVTIPNSVTSIGESAFRNCSSLTSLTIPNSVTSIGGAAFYGCSGLTSVTIGNSVTSIGGEAFSGCSGLTSLTIPNSMTSIGDYAFIGCTNLTSITIPSSVTSIGRLAFHGTKLYDNQPDGVVYVDKVLYAYKGTMPSNTKIDIKEGTTVIADGAFDFDGCSGLTSVTIPNSVTGIGKNAFCRCSGLTSLTIPNSVTSIGGYAFYECSGLTSITCEAITPPNCGSSCFYDINKSIPVYVVANSVDAYKTANLWKDFTNIQAIPTTYTLTDGELYNIGSQRKGCEISYTRTFNNTAWQALYIPFSLNYNDWKDNFEIAYINGVRQLDKDDNGTIDETIMDVIKIKSGSTSPNMPYLIKAKKTGEKTFSVSNATLYPAEENSVDCSTTIAKYTFTGTYNAIPSATMIANGYYAMGGGDLIQSDGSNDLKPYRWYMKVESRNPSYNVSNAAKTITINVIDEEGETTTGVEELQMTNCKSPVYDLNGRKVNENNLKPGIYVKNGKKFVVK